MKLKFMSVILSILMILAVFTACGSDTDKEPTDSSSAEQTTVLTEQTEADTTESTTQDDISVNTETAGYINSKESFVNAVSGLVDLSKYKDLHTSDSGSFVIYAYNLEYDYEQDYNLDYKVQLSDGTEFTMPITFDDLAEKGWVLTESSQPDYELKEGLMTYGIVRNADGKEFHVAAWNPTEKTIKFKDCTVINFDSQQYGSSYPFKELEEAVDFTVCGTLTNASTMEEIIEKLGEPTSITCTLHNQDGAYQYSKVELSYMQMSTAYSNIVFTLSGDGNYIIDFSYDVDPT